MRGLVRKAAGCWVLGTVRVLRMVLSALSVPETPPPAMASITVIRLGGDR